MIGIGSRPVSAIRPAKTEMTDGGPPASSLATISSTWASVRSAVTLSLTPRLASLPISAAELSCGCW